MTNVSLKISTRECVPDNHFLGYEGENEVNKLIFKFEDGFFDGSGLLNIQRGEQNGYVTVNKVGETYELEVKNSLLSQKGDVTFQLSITSTEGKVIKFDPFVMTVKDAIDTDAELPEEYPSWIDEANAKLAEIDQAIEDAEKLSAKVEPTEKGALITITDKEGTTTAEVFHGTGEGTGGGIVTETDPTVPSWAKQATKPTYTKKEVGLENVDNIKQYSIGNPPPYPVRSVNGKTGDVVIDNPTKTSELINDSNFATIDDVEKEIATFDFIKVVDSLPETGLPNRIYFVPKEDNETQDLFDEYAWINDKWEFITTKQMKIDLTPYATKEELNSKQDTLVSGINVKTINNQSILGSGNMTIEGDSSGGSNPTGTIISFMGLLAPDGYLICDGSELNIDVFPNLANHFETQFGTKNHFGGDGATTFALPDLRNEFLRGYHGGASEQLSGEVGIHQEATKHVPIGTDASGAVVYYSASASNIDEDMSTGQRDATLKLSANKASSPATALNYTSRPTNVAVLYCIKY